VYAFVALADSEHFASVSTYLPSGCSTGIPTDWPQFSCQSVGLPPDGRYMLQKISSGDGCAMDLGYVDMSSLFSSGDYASCDIKSSTRASGKKYNAIHDTILSSLSTVGFLLVRCDGLSDMAKEAVESSRGFFALDDSEKAKALSVDRARRGYSPLLADNFASLLVDGDGEKETTSAVKRQNDLVEKFRMGPPASLQESMVMLADKSQTYFTSKEGKLHFFPNTWPATPSNFQSSLSSFYLLMRRVSLKILSLLNDVLELPDSNFFQDRMDKDTSILSVNFFPHLSASSSTSSTDSTSFSSSTTSTQLRIAEHTDVSLITVVYQTGDGLEVFDASTGGWFTVPHSPDTFVVNVGDCLQDWSRGLLRSTKHRVRLPISAPVGLSTGASAEDAFTGADADADADSSSGKRSETSSSSCNSERISIAFFASPNYDTEMAWPLGCCSFSTSSSSASSSSAATNVSPPSSSPAAPVAVVAANDAAPSLNVVIDCRSQTASSGSHITYSMWRKMRIKRAIEKNKTKNKNS